LLFGRWVILFLYTIYKLTYLQNRLQRNCFSFGRLYILQCYLWVYLGSSHNSLTHTFTHVCHLSKQSTMHKRTSHSHKNTLCSHFSSSVYTHGNDVFLLRASAGNVSLPGDLFGIQTDSASLEIRHLQSHFAYGILWSNYEREPPWNVCVILPHVLRSRKALRMAICQVEKQFLSPLPCSDNSVTSPFYPICPHIPCEHYSPLLHEV